MTATNHAITGALLGLAIGNPFLAVPLAFASHFVLDSLPHYGSKTPDEELLGSNKFAHGLLLDASLCGVLVLGLLLSRPHHWLTAAFCAFAATSPDFMWFTKFLAARRNKPGPIYKNPLVKLHTIVQWSQTPRGKYVEIVWLVGGLTVLITRILALR